MMPVVSARTRVDLRGARAASIQSFISRQRVNQYALNHNKVCFKKNHTKRNLQKEFNHDVEAQTICAFTDNFSQCLQPAAGRQWYLHACDSADSAAETTRKLCRVSGPIGGKKSFVLSQQMSYMFHC